MAVEADMRPAMDPRAQIVTKQHRTKLTDLPYICMIFHQKKEEDADPILSVSNTVISWCVRGQSRP